MLHALRYQHTNVPVNSLQLYIGGVLTTPQLPEYPLAHMGYTLTVWPILGYTFINFNFS